MECILCGGEIEKKYDIKGRMYWDQGENAQPLADNVAQNVIYTLLLLGFQNFQRLRD